MELTGFALHYDPFTRELWIFGARAPFLTDDEIRLKPDEATCRVGFDDYGQLSGGRRLTAEIEAVPGGGWRVCRVTLHETAGLPEKA